MKRLLFIILFLGLNSFSQTFVEGYVLDKSNNEALPYATVRLLKTNYYTITNQDGKFHFETNNEVQVDSIEVRFYGFKTVIVSQTYFAKHTNIYLEPSISNLDEVYLITDKREIKKNKNRNYNLLYSLIKKYRNKDNETKSKAFLSLTSSARNTPIEQIEGFYNSTQSLSQGLINLKLKSGRFGQNKKYPFYSIDNTLILSDFNLFKEAHQILPFYPGNMGLGGIKSKYNLEIENCISCDFGDTKISFSPKKQKGKYFSGSIVFDKKALTIKKINLIIIEPVTERLTSIVENDIIIPKELTLQINFNPLDYNKIQSYDFKFVLDYTSDISSETITSNSFLYFYDYETSFELPYYINPIEFRNDYDQIIAQQSSTEFWNSNYQYPKSYTETRSMEFMKQHGFLINYTNEIPTDYIKIINPSVIAWSNELRLNWNSIKQSSVIIKNDKTNFEKLSKSASTHYDKQSYSISSMSKSKTESNNIGRINFSYVIDFNKIDLGENQHNSRTIFNRATSYYNGSESDNKLVYFNLIFDIYEYYRQKIETINLKNSSFDNIKLEYENAYKEATEIVKQLKKETNRGDNFQQLINWNNKIKSKLGIDNYNLIKK